MKHIKFRSVIAILLVLSTASVVAVLFLYKNSTTTAPANLPSPTLYREIEQAQPIKQQDSAIQKPKNTEINLAVPFTSQAPHKKWDEPYKEFCEEASVLMTYHYIAGKDIPNADYADTELLKIKDFEEKTFGFWADTDAEHTARILREYYQINDVEVLKNPTAEDIKSALNQKRLVLVPAAGQLLENPHFRQPGPPYHMIVIKGYTKENQFITNDPGTQFGKDYLYPIDRIMNAMHDWSDGNVLEGEKIIIIVG